MEIDFYPFSIDLPGAVILYCSEKSTIFLQQLFRFRKKQVPQSWAYPGFFRWGTLSQKIFKKYSKIFKNFEKIFKNFQNIFKKFQKYFHVDLISLTRISKHFLRK